MHRNIPEYSAEYSFSYCSALTAYIKIPLVLLKMKMPEPHSILLNENLWVWNQGKAF